MSPKPKQQSKGSEEFEFNVLDREEPTIVAVEYCDVRMNFEIYKEQTTPEREVLLHVNRMGVMLSTSDRKERRLY